MSMNGRLNGHTAQVFKPDSRAKERALHLYEHACSRSWLDTARSFFNGRSRRLLGLEQFHATCTILTDKNLGVQSIPISQIQGSVNAGRSYDFDADFRPLKIHNKERWLGLAAAYERGVKIPSVILVQIGDIYFVQDGHHRISVMRAMGQTEVPAIVTTWQVAGPLPWAKQAGSNSSRRPIKSLTVQSYSAE